MIKRTNYPEEFNRQLGLEPASGMTSAGEMSKREGISTNTLCKWRDMAQGMEVTPDEKEILEISQVIAGDGTTYDLHGKDHYCASLMDRHNREVIGKAVSDKNNTALVPAALEDAHHNRPDIQACIHHRCADVRFYPDEYINRLKDPRMRISMCVGNAYENAHAESFNKTIKRQEINISDYDSKEESAVSIFRFVEFYNSFQPHPSLGGMTPIGFIMADKRFSNV